MDSNIIETKSISELFGGDFFIPSYQRGYRWDKQQVLDLLQDVHDFQVQTNPNTREENWYCLQPLVVKNIHKDGKDVFEVIDGQQRLTTIYFMYRELFQQEEPFSITYATREKTKLSEVKKDTKPENIDEYFMKEALNEIDKFREQVKKEDFKKKIEDNCKVIWYKISEKENAYEVFKRLNSGKISLSNAELIKAVILQKENFTKSSKDFISLKQLEISGEWDRIEQYLKNDAFWYFVNPNPESSAYNATRIDFIFELVLRCRKNDKNEYMHPNFDTEIEKNPYFSFSVFNSEISKDSSNYQKIWKEIQSKFRIIKTWYENREVYHYVGYLMNQKGVDKQKLLCDLLCDAENNDKNIFLELLKENCCASLVKLNGYKKELDLETLKYGSNNELIHNILLLFNLASVQNQKSEETRYPFHRHFQATKKKWSLEHIHAQKSERVKWNENEIKLIKKYLFQISSDKEDTRQKLSDFITVENINDDVYYAIISCFMTKENPIKTFEDRDGKPHVEYDVFEKDDSIKNMALLQGDKNARLGNKIFPSKREVIKKYEKNGAFEDYNNDEFFVPLCTRNVFFKHYSSSDTANPLMWTEQDGTEYLNAMVSMITKFLGFEKIENNNEKTIKHFKEFKHINNIYQDECKIFFLQFDFAV